MTDNTNRGATADEWFHFDFNLGLGANLLPCVPSAPDVQVLAGSALEGKVGKIPSQFNREGKAHGLKDWQKRPILSNEIALWSKDPRLNICVRTGPISGVYAIDIDIDDTELAHEVLMHIVRPDSTNSIRTRENSGKCLVPFRLEGGSCKKRIIKLDNNPKGPRIELLADGQQFVAAGSHSSGVRYQWLPHLPTDLPTLTLEQLNSIWETLSRTFATPTQTSAGNQQTSTHTTPSPGQDTTTVSTLSEINEEQWQELLSSLRFLLDKVSDNDTWSSVGYALLSLQTSRPAYQLWLDFSRKAVGYEEGAPETWWEAHKAQKPRSDWRHIINLAHGLGRPRLADPSAFPIVPAEANSAPEASDAQVSGGDSGASIPSTISVVPDAPIKPVIQLVQGNYANLIDQIETLMVPDIYVQGPHLTRQTQAHEDKKIRRASDALMLTKVTQEWLKYRIGTVALVQKWLKSDSAWVNTDITNEYVNGLLNLGGWTRIRPLNAIARSPFVREDGSICDQPGYDSGARVLYVPGTEYPALPAEPDKDCARAAIERIRGVFDQFPWKEPASESAFLSHILAEAARLAIDCCPIYFYDAPSAGTGKGLLQEMAARIVHGNEPAIRPWVSDGDEIRKSLYASLLAGDRSLWFDNIPTGHKTRSPELCAFLTSSTWKDRKLGESETLGVPNKCVLVGSGNNVTPTGDLARRSIVIRMDANTEKLKERVFKIPEGHLRPYVMEHRPQMLIDALTVIKAFHAAKDISNMPVALQSFGQWSHFCRNPLIWLGFPDPVDTQKETDDENQSVSNIFDRLYSHFGENEFSGMDVARIVNGITDANGELANDLIENGCAEPNQPKKVGYWLRGCRDRIGNGLKLVHSKQGMHGVKWRFVRMHEDLT